MKRAWLVVFMSVVVSGELFGQEPAVLESVFGSSSELLFETRAAVASGRRIAVLTAHSIHVLSDEGSVEWGRKGQGPGELAEPVDITWTDAHIGILDIGNGRIELFDERGEHVRSQGIGSLWARRIDIVAGDTVLGTFVPMSDDRAVLRVRGARADTLLEYTRRGDSVRLEANGAPSLTLKAPFSAQVEWTILPDGGLAWYEVESRELTFSDRDGRVKESIRLEWPGTKIGDAEREWWFATAIPDDFQGRRVFGPLRDVARREVEFPHELPAVLGLEADTRDGVWVKRALSTQGEVWRLVRSNGAVSGELRLPPGRRLLAVGEAGLFALTRDEVDLELIEVYRRPAWAM